MNKLLLKFMDKLRFLYKDDCNCILCDAEIGIKNRYGLCRECMLKLPRVGTNICQRCGKPMNNDAEYCMSCLNTPRVFNTVRSALVYRDEAVKLLLGLKFHNQRYLARYLAPYIQDVLHNCQCDYDIIVPIPISAQRLAIRHYNQVEEVMRFVTFDKPINNHSLVKVKHNEQQSKMSARDRKLNVHGVFAVMDRTAFKGKRVLLIDDVLTTGATMDEAAAVLLRAGALEVNGITLANAPYRLIMDKKIDKEFDFIACQDVIYIDKEQEDKYK